MVDVALMVAGVCPPETFESLPKVELAVEGEGRQYPAEDDGLSATDVEGRNAGCHCVSIAGGYLYAECMGTVAISNAIYSCLNSSTHVRLLKGRGGVRLLIRLVLHILRLSFLEPHWEMEGGTRLLFLQTWKVGVAEKMSLKIRVRL